MAISTEQLFANQHSPRPTREDVFTPEARFAALAGEADLEDALAIEALHKQLTDEAQSPRNAS